MLIQVSINCYLKRLVIKSERIFGEKRQEKQKKRRGQKYEFYRAEIDR